jgi:anti-sigma B factor antagonist
MPEFSIKVKEIGAEKAVKIVKVDGEIDIHVAPQLKNEILNMMQENGLQMLLDLQGVSYLDSYSLGVFVTLRKRIRELDGNLSIMCSNPRIVRLFEITQLNKIFTFFAGEDEFIKSVSAKVPGS